MKLEDLITHYEKRRVELYDEKEFLLEDDFANSYTMGRLQALYDEVCIILDNLKRLRDEKV